MNNRDRLIELLSDHELERREVAELLKVKAALVNHWLSSHESNNYEEMPDMAIELLEINWVLKKHKLKDEFSITIQNKIIKR